MTELVQVGMEGRARGVPSYGARAVVERIGDRKDLFPAVGRELRSLGHVLSDRLVGVFDRSCASRCCEGLIGKPSRRYRMSARHNMSSPCLCRRTGYGSCGHRQGCVYALGLCVAQMCYQVCEHLALGDFVDAPSGGGGTMGFSGPYARSARDLPGRPTLGRKLLEHTKENGVRNQLGAFESLVSCVHTRCSEVVSSVGVGQGCRSTLSGAKAGKISRGLGSQRYGGLPSRAVANLHRHDRCWCFQGELFVALSLNCNVSVGCQT